MKKLIMATLLLLPLFAFATTNASNSNRNNQRNAKPTTPPSSNGDSTDNNICKQADFEGNWLALIQQLEERIVLQIDSNGSLIGGGFNPFIIKTPPFSDAVLPILGGADTNEFILYKTSDKLDCEFSANINFEGATTTTTITQVDIPIAECIAGMQGAYGSWTSTTPYYIDPIYGFYVEFNPTAPNYSTNGVCVKNVVSSVPVTANFKYTGIISQDKGMMVLQSKDSVNPLDHPAGPDPLPAVGATYILTLYNSFSLGLGSGVFVKSQ